MKITQPIRCCQVTKRHAGCVNQYLIMFQILTSFQRGQKTVSHFNSTIQHGLIPHCFRRGPKFLLRPKRFISVLQVSSKRINKSLTASLKGASAAATIITIIVIMLVYKWPNKLDRFVISGLSPPHYTQFYIMWPPSCCITNHGCLVVFLLMLSHNIVASLG